ncbi:MAG: hypothetical protein Q8K50_23540 [Hydrogenophaga sp.]|jgi:hypothetical protein|nr:hypothetical protein [Hydrogenophaga sp.]MDP2096830.1 hypothetical protein [Hydrogenophaga sp.]
MSITLQEARNAILSGGFFEKSSTVKLSEFESKTTGRILYLYKQQGLPGHADVIVHPERNAAALLAIPDIEPNKRVTYRFGSNMSTFPKKVNKGAGPEHCGRALYVRSQGALSALCKAYDS